jgi:hypothetical protein
MSAPTTGNQPAETKTRPRARLATIDALRDDLLPIYLSPVPPRKTLHQWFKRANIPCFKANPAAKSGGGPVFYSVAAVEKLIRRQTGTESQELEGVAA